MNTLPERELGRVGTAARHARAARRADQPGLGRGGRSRAGCRCRSPRPRPRTPCPAGSTARAWPRWNVAVATRCDRRRPRPRRSTRRRRTGRRPRRTARSPPSSPRSPRRRARAARRSCRCRAARRRSRAPGRARPASNAAGGSPGQAAELLGRVVRTVLGRPDGEHLDLAAGRAQQPRGDEPVAAVVALAADDRDPPGRARAARPRAASPSPARSIRSSDGMPFFSIAQWSVARISSASSSGSIQRGRLIRSPPPRPPCRPCG